MRTLKKSLCLVLALVFVLGLCTVGSNAATVFSGKYSDVEDITDEYMDAVEVLSGLGVVEGRTDGTFDPAANVTRAEACAMIARMMLGPDAADKLPVGDVKFTDVSLESWEGRMAKYIAFCANRGIVVGMGDGTFHPTENVTGTQLATMLLRALGYGAIGEYEGKGWDVNAVADALYYGVFKDSKDDNFDDAATREETALYIWNTMWIQLVGYDVDLNYYDGKVRRVAWMEYEPLYFAREAFNLIQIGVDTGYDEVVIKANQDTGAKYTEIGLDVDDGEIDYRLAYETPLDQIGHQVTIFINAEAKEDTKEHCDYYECYLIRDESTVLDKGSTFDDFYRAAKAANKDNEKTPLGTVTTWRNYDYTNLGVVGGIYDYDNFAYYTKIADLKGQKSTMDNSAYISGTWILDHEGKLFVVLKTSYQIGKVAAVDDDHEEVEVKVWISDGYDDYEYEYEYVYEYERDADGFLVTDENGDPIIKRDEEGKRVKVLDKDGKPVMRIVYDENGDPVPAKDASGKIIYKKDAEGNTIHVDTSHFDPQIFDQRKGDKELVYEGIAKNDYVVIQPVGELIYIQPTTTATVDITQRNLSNGSWYFNNYSYYPDSNGLGIIIEDQDDPADVGVGDQVLFYISKDYGIFKYYFGVQILEKAESGGIVYVNYATEAIALSDWDSFADAHDETTISTAYKVQCINEDGEEVVYTMKKDDDDPKYAEAFEAMKAGAGNLYEVFVRGKYATFQKAEDAQLIKKGGANSYLSGFYDIYYVTDDSNVIYFSGEGAKLKISGVTSKLKDESGYNVYFVAKKSGGKYRITTAWVPGQKAPAAAAEGSYVFIPDAHLSTWHYKYVDPNPTLAAKYVDGIADIAGYEKLPDGKSDPYYTAYKDGVEIRLHIDSDSQGTFWDGFDPGCVYSGYYEYKYDAEKGTYMLYPVEIDDEGGQIEEVWLTSDNVQGGRLYYTARGKGQADGVLINCEVVDISGGTTIKTKTDANVNSVERLEELLDEDYMIRVNFMYVRTSKGSLTPVGYMYVTSVYAPAA